MKITKKRQLLSFASALTATTVLSLGTLTTVFAENTYHAEALTLCPADSTYSINVNWYANRENAVGAKVKFSIANQEDIITDASITQASEGKVSCKAVVNGLTPGVSYKYQVSSDNGATWSKAYTYKATEYGDFSFAFVGDPQLNGGEQDKNSAAFSSDKTTASGWADTLAKIEASGVSFIASAGDQVDTTNDGVEAEYNDFFAPSQMQSLPFAPAVGNHDRHALFNYHYNLPNVIAADPAIALATGTPADKAQIEAATGNYFYMVNNALFVVLNDSAYPQNTEQAKPFIEAFNRTLQEATAAHPDYKWLFVQHHKSTASAARHVADEDIQYYVEAGFETLMDKYAVDFVLAGHDHVYVRSYAMKGGKRVSDDANHLVNPEGTVYLTCNTGSGLKYYDIFDGAKLINNPSYPYLANGLVGSDEYLKGVYPLSTNIAIQNKIPGYTIVKVGADKVTFTTYATYGNNSKLDEFSVSK